MKLLVLSAADVHELLGFGDCVDAMRAGLTALAAGRANQPLRVINRPASAPGLIGLMPAYLPAEAGQGAPGGAGAGPPDGTRAGAPDGAGAGAPDGAGAYGLKALVITAGNPAVGLDAHQGLVLLSDGQTGEPLAVLNASAVTEIRTAAVSVLATDLLARPGAGDVAVIGTGVQARAHVLAFDQTRSSQTRSSQAGAGQAGAGQAGEPGRAGEASPVGKIGRIRVAGRDPAKTEAFVASLRPLVSVDLVASPSVRDAVAGAGIIVTATSSAEPVLRREWIADGAHINAVGACLPTTRELDSATLAAAALFADSRESLTSESGDYLLALADGLVGPGHIRAELGELLTGSAPGRASDTEITVFESLGLAIEDLAAARTAYQKAASTGAGQWVDF
jgi:ornithine cyclodeaminase/alanine dehydrogenase-like protein (mu-crystallin family)